MNPKERMALLAKSKNLRGENQNVGKSDPSGVMV